MKGKPDLHIDADGPAELLASQYSALAPPSPTDPRTVFPSALKLSREHEDRLVKRARDRYDLLATELGRENTGTDDVGTPLFFNMNKEDRTMACRTFMAKRMLYSYMAANDYSWRPFLNRGSIFETSNLAVPLCRRISRQMAAKAITYFFGTDPYFSVEPVGASDEGLSNALQTLANLKVRDSDSDNALRSAVETAFNLGECVLKVTHRRSSSFYRQIRSVAVADDGTTPLLAQDGLPIEPTDPWVPAEDGSMVLKRDGATPHPGPLRFVTMLTDEEIVHYNGPQIDPVYFRDLLAPLNARTLQKDDCDCCVQIMEMTASALAASYMQNPGEGLDSLRSAIESIRRAISSPREGQSAASMRPELGDSIRPETLDATLQIGEFYLRFDADMDGYEEDVMLVMDLNTDTPIFYDYVPNVTDDGLRPFRVVKPTEISGRWYGSGAIEMFEESQKIIDLLVNRRNRNQSEAGRMTLFRAYNTVEGDADPNLKMNFGHSYTPKPGMRAEDIVETVEMYDNKFDRLTEEIEFWLQTAMNESGVQHANDNYVAGMDTAKLATGIRNVEKTGSELFAVMISNLEVGIQAAVDVFVTTLFANLDTDETVTILEDKVPDGLLHAEKQVTISPRDVQGLKFNVKVLLTRMKDEHVMQSCMQSEALITKFYSLPPPLQPVVAKFYVNMLRALKVRDPERYIVPQPFSIGAPGGSGVPITGTPSDMPSTPPPNL